MLNENSKPEGESDHKIFTVVVNHRPYFRKLMFFNVWDADELEQNLQIKFFEKYVKEPDSLNGIQNLNAYVRVAAKHESINMLKQNSRRKNHDSIYDKDTDSLIDKIIELSDEGLFSVKILQDIDSKRCRKTLIHMLEELSQYEKTLVWLKIFEGCKPTHIVEILLDEYPNLLKAEFPEYSGLNKQELREKLRYFVPKDCNSAEAKYRQKLKNKF